MGVLVGKPDAQTTAGKARWPLGLLQTVPPDLVVKPGAVLGHGLARMSGDEISR